MAVGMAQFESVSRELTTSKSSKERKQTTGDKVHPYSEDKTEHFGYLKMHIILEISFNTSISPLSKIS